MRITKENVIEFASAAGIRALKTAAQTAAAMISPALAGEPIDWVRVAVVSGIAAVYSIVTSLATGLPEVTTTGKLEAGETG